MGDVLVVRHGAGRGRMPRVNDDALDLLAERRPDVGRAVRRHATGEPRPDLAGVGAVVFWLGDPLRERYPDCFEEAAVIAREARDRGLRVVNPPEALSNSVKSVQARLWADAGLTTARHVAFADPDELVARRDEVRFPAFVRADQDHLQRHMHLCDTAAAVGTIPPEEIAYPGALAELIDTRWDPEEAPHPIWSTLFHKKRILVMGPVLRTTHLFFGRSPIVSAYTSTFREAQLRRRRPWRAGRQEASGSWLRRAIADDLAYWQQGQEAPEVMVAAVRALDLDYAAIDYSTRADGSVVLWEANPHFGQAGRRNRNLMRRRRTVERLQSYREAVADFVEAVADGW